MWSSPQSMQVAFSASSYSWISCFTDSALSANSSAEYPSSRLQFYKYALRLIIWSNCFSTFLNRFLMFVLFASIRPDTLCGDSTKGLFLERATWMEAGPQEMKLAYFFSRMRCRLQWIWVASTSPWIMFRIEMQQLSSRLGWVDSMMFLVCRSRFITSKTEVFCTLVACCSIVRGVQPVMRKWQRGVGMRLASRPMRSLFMQPGQRRVVVEAAMTVETRELTWAKEGLSMLSRSVAIRLRAVLSSTTTASAFWMSRFMVRMELQGCTTTSLVSSMLGNTLQVSIIFLGNRSFSFSSRLEPRPDPVPPAIEWMSRKPSRESEPSASRSIISIRSSVCFSALLQPATQLLPAPPPSLERKMFSGLQKREKGLFLMAEMTLGSRSMRMARGMQWSSSAWQKKTSLLSSQGSARASLVSMPSLSMPCSLLSCFQNSKPIWLPHWPAWMVMISRGMIWMDSNVNMSGEQLEKRIDNYVFRMSDVLGSGSYSVVYRGRSLLGGESVAIKVVNKGLIKDELAYENMKKEIKVMGELEHPNIVRFLAVFQTVNNIYIIMEYCNQGTLLALMRRAGTLPQSQVWAVLAQLARAFRFLVQKQVLHRDIKPENILLADGVAKLVDFGFACSLSEGLSTVLQDNMGSPLYMSPQLLLGESYSAKSDVWSLGIVVYEMLYGRTPWPSKDKPELIYKTLHHPLHIFRGPSSAIIQFIIGCLKIREADRLSFPECFALIDKHKPHADFPILSQPQPSAPTLVSIKSNIQVPKKQFVQAKLSGLSAITPFRQQFNHQEVPQEKRPDKEFFRSQDSTQPETRGEQVPFLPHKLTYTQLGQIPFYLKAQLQAQTNQGRQLLQQQISTAKLQVFIPTKVQRQPPIRPQYQQLPKPQLFPQESVQLIPQPSLQSLNPQHALPRDTPHSTIVSQPSLMPLRSFQSVPQSSMLRVKPLSSAKPTVPVQDSLPRMLQSFPVQPGGEGWQAGLQWPKAYAQPK